MSPPSLLLLCFLSLVCFSSAQQIPVFDVTAYGAVGDGHTDCTQAVAKAMVALLASPAGGTLYFPAGAFILLEVPPSSLGYIGLTNSAATGETSALNVVGAGANETTLVYNSTAASLFSVSSPNVQGGSIQGLAVYAYAEELIVATNPAIVIENASGWAVQNVVFDFQADRE
jgi:hypothetical protein